MNNYIDIEKLTKNNEKIYMYIKEESLKINNIKEIFNNINMCLDINESNHIENLQFELNKKLKTINKIHNNNHIVIEKKINKYIEAARMTNEIFNNIDVGE